MEGSLRSSESLIVNTKGEFINILLDRILMGKEILSMEIASDEALMPIMRDADIYEEVNRITINKYIPPGANDYLKYYISVLPAVDADSIPGKKTSSGYKIKLFKAKVNNSIARLFELLKVIERIEVEKV